MSPLSAELAEGSLHKHIQDHKGKPDVTMSLRWAAEVAGGTWSKLLSYRPSDGKRIVFKEWVTFMVKKLCTETSSLPTVWGHSALCHVIILCIIHGAILLASELMVAKICDFGTARLLDHKTKATLAGTYSWMAPEVRTL